jgi:hypothetical protein
MRGAARHHPEKSLAPWPAFLPHHRHGPLLGPAMMAGLLSGVAPASVDALALTLTRTWLAHGSRGHLCLHLAAPMAMVCDGFDEFRRHAVSLRMTTDDDPFVGEHLIASTVRPGKFIHSEASGT